MTRRCGPLTPAQMDKRVTLQAVTHTPDGQGGQTEAWADVAEVWARLEPLRAWERVQAMQTQTPVTHRITIRYRADVTSACRFAYEGRVLWAKEVIDEHEAKTFLTIKAIERSHP